ncbi:hypothetical protein NE865_12120 [Phthorimaea operculella]|nr:hypothetical protein NE865_12120 [Phthorimaea operculella]
MQSWAFKYVFCLFFVLSISFSKEVDKDQVDKVIEDEITVKLSEDLLQSIEKKFQVDLERSVDSVLTKIKHLLHNGTTRIQERLVILQNTMDAMRNDSETEVNQCLLDHQNETTSLAEKALHQMVVCGYALIGHDPAQAVRNVVQLKDTIKQGLKPLYEQKQEINKVLKVCGHEHDSLKKVIKCVISKSPELKSAMMGVSGKLIDGVVHLTKQMAHGAMHEACLIEVINTVEEEAFALLNKVKTCALKSDSAAADEVEKYIRENNATVLDTETKSEKKGTAEAKDNDLEKAEKKDPSDVTVGENNDINDDMIAD